MSKIRDLIEKIKQYYKFSPDELISLAVTIGIVSFMLSFNDWGAEKFDVAVGIAHLMTAVVVVVLSLLVNLSVKRIAALHIGYRLEYKMWLPGLIFGLIICVLANTLTNGTDWGWLFIAPGTIVLHHLVGHRLGFFRYGINLWSKSMIIIWGLISTMLLTILFKILDTAHPGNYFFHKMFVFNLVLAVFLVLPIPLNDGSFVLFATRGIYVFILGAIIGWALLIYFTNIALSLIGSLLIGGISLLIFYLFMESGFFR